MEAFWWLFAIVLMALGLIGTVIPIVPGTTIMLAAAVVHRVALGADRSLGMSALIAMLALTLLTYVQLMLLPDTWGRNASARQNGV